MPLPPYIDRDPDDPRLRGLDRERYQTVFAAEPGAVAAPTAGLHLTPELLRALDAAGVQRATVTLHVGLGTFLPVRAVDIREHRMHSERYTVGEAARGALVAARERGAAIVAVGTTVARVLETLARGGPAAGETDIFIHPQAPPTGFDGLLTNFHLPESTLLMLVAGLIGREPLLARYREAVAGDYRFYSYGDAMLIQPPRGMRSGR